MRESALRAPDLRRVSDPRGFVSLPLGGDVAMPPQAIVVVQRENRRLRDDGAERFVGCGQSCEPPTDFGTSAWPMIGIASSPSAPI